MHYLCLFAYPGLLVSNVLEINSVLICQVEEKIKILFSLFPLLLVSKDKIDPVADMLAHVVRLQLDSMLYDEVIG